MGFHLFWLKNDPVLNILTGSFIKIVASTAHSMNIERFHSLSMPQQHYYVMNRGVYLSSRHERSFSVDLYEVSGFYVEIFYELGEEEFSFLRGFASTHNLDPYLAGIDIDQLFC
jgi:hypothetical protein